MKKKGNINSFLPFLPIVEQRNLALWLLRHSFHQESDNDQDACIQQPKYIYINLKLAHWFA